MNRYAEKMGGLQKHDCGEWVEYADHLEALRKCRESVLAEVRKAWDDCCSYESWEATVSEFHAHLEYLEAKK